MKSSVVIFLSFLFIGAFANKVAITDVNAGDSLVDYIDTLRNDVVAEQNAHQTLAEQQDAECERELAFRNTEVNAANNSLIASDTHLKKCSGALDQANTDLANLESQLEVVQGQLSNLEENRAAALALFQTHEQEHIDAINAVDEAFDILGEFANSNAAGVALLAQLGKHITKQIKVSVASKFFMHYAPVIAFLASTPKDVTISSEDLDKLTGLFQKLRDNLEASLADLRDVEADAVESYNQQKELFNSQIDTINAAIDNFAGYVITMKRCIATETEVSSEASSKLSRNAKILENTQAMCDAFDQEFADASAARKEKINNLQLLQDLVESKVAQYNAGGFYHASD
jgi:septal ring factor EnvC (AmiA/AmiB activator)